MHIKNFPKRLRQLRAKLPELSYKRQKNVWAVIFLMPWLIGFALLFLTPMVRSFLYSFYDLTPRAGEILTEFIRFDNYLYAINEHVFRNTTFRTELVETTFNVVINLPVLLIFSLFIAVMLNAKFKGRAIVRAIFFIPVILNSAAVATALESGASFSAMLAEQNIETIFDLEFYLLQTGMTPALISFIVELIARIYSILALAGVPILLFLASIQSIPKHLYEAAKIEGATAYEQFWLITFPNVTPYIIVVIVFALVDTFLTSPLSLLITHELNRQNWGLSSAMAWLYVATIIIILAVIALLAKVLRIGGSHYEN